MIPAGLLTESIELFSRKTTPTLNGNFTETFDKIGDYRAYIIRLKGGVNISFESEISRYDIGFRLRWVDVKARDRIVYNGVNYKVDYVEPYALKRGINIYCFAET